MINCAVIMGRLTKNPELRTTQSGTSVTSFCVAVDRSYVKPGEERQADFINVVAWRSTADFINRNFTKGDMIAIQGSIQTRSYEDKNGNKRIAVEVVADSVSFCGGKNNQNDNSAEINNNPPSVPFSELPTDDDDDGLPF